MRIQGKDVALYANVDGVNGKEIGYSTTCDVQVTCDVSEFSSILSGGAKRMRPGRYGWQMSCDIMAESGDNTAKLLLLSLKSKRAITVAMTLSADGAEASRVYGEGYATSWQLSGAVGSMAIYQVTITGDGDLNV